MRTSRFSSRKRSPVPLVVLAILVLLLGCWIFNLTCRKTKSTTTSQYLSYVEEANVLVQKSNEMNAKRKGIKENLSKLMNDPKLLDEELQAVVQGCLEVRDGVYDLNPPPSLNVPDAALKICMERRYKSMEKYRADIINAIESIDLSVYVDNIAAEMNEIYYADGDYQFFKSEVDRVLKEKGMMDTSVLDSRWLTGMSEASPREIENFLKALRGAELHGLALGPVTLEPSGRLDEKNVFHLPRTDTLDISIVVENQGNRAEAGVPIVVSLYSSADTTPRREEQVIESIGPGEKITVTFRGLIPTPGGTRNVLEIKVGPVPREAFLENNQKVIYFVME